MFCREVLKLVTRHSSPPPSIHSSRFPAHTYLNVWYSWICRLSVTDSSILGADVLKKSRGLSSHRTDRGYPRILYFIRVHPHMEYIYGVLRSKLSHGFSHQLLSDFLLWDARWRSDVSLWNWLELHTSSLLPQYSDLSFYARSNVCYY